MGLTARPRCEHRFLLPPYLRITLPADRLLDAILAAGLPAFAKINRSAFRLGHDAVREVISEP